jgi:hypothetical protein
LFLSPHLLLPPPRLYQSLPTPPFCPTNTHRPFSDPPLTPLITFIPCLPQTSTAVLLDSFVRASALLEAKDDSDRLKERKILGHSQVGRGVEPSGDESDGSWRCRPGMRRAGRHCQGPHGKPTRDA